MAKKKKNKKLAKKAVTRALPPAIKFSLPEIVISDCPEAKQLAGDYILPLVRRSPNFAIYRLVIEPACGYRSVLLTIRQRDDDQCYVRLRFRGAAQSVSWGQLLAADLSGPLNLSRLATSSAPGSWPEQLTIEAVQSPASTGTRGMDKRGRTTQVLAAGSSQGAGVDLTCGCNGVDELGAIGEMQGLTTGDDENPCLYCDDYNESFDMGISTECNWVYQWVPPYCSLVQIDFTLFDEIATGEVRLFAAAGDFSTPEGGVDFEKIVPLQDFDPGGSYDLSPIDPPTGVDCDYTGASIKLSFSPGSSPPGPATFDCSNKQGSCEDPLIVPPGVDGMPDLAPAVDDCPDEDCKKPDDPMPDLPGSGPGAPGSSGGAGAPLPPGSRSDGGGGGFGDGSRKAYNDPTGGTPDSSGNCPCPSGGSGSGTGPGNGTNPFPPGIGPNGPLGLPTNTGCVSGSCSASINEVTASLQVTLPVPSIGTGDFTADVMYTSALGSSGGSDFLLLIDEQVTVDTTSGRASVQKHDGGTHYYVNKNATSGEYQSTGRNPAKLKANTNGTYSETQADGKEYIYDSTGALSVVKQTRAPGTNVWTISHDTSTSHVKDPYGRRTTYVYDSNGHLKRVHDVYNRITSFQFTAGGSLTKQTTPELCVTEMRYDASDRLQTIIAPEGGRTTYGYDSGGRASQVTYPDGGKYTYTYLSGKTTTITDPAANVTTVLHDAARNIVATINPKGDRTSYLYDRSMLTTYIPPVGGSHYVHLQGLR